MAFTCIVASYLGVPCINLVDNSKLHGELKGLQITTYTSSDVPVIKSVIELVADMAFFTILVIGPTTLRTDIIIDNMHGKYTSTTICSLQSSLLHMIAIKSVLHYEKPYECT